MEWNFDIASAPKGRNETRTRPGKDGKVIEYTHRIEERVWLASASEAKVYQSYWIEPTKLPDGRWSGFAEGQKPLAWAPFVVPKHPGFGKGVEGGATAAESPTLITDNQPATRTGQKTGGKGNDHDNL